MLPIEEFMHSSIQPVLHPHNVHRIERELKHVLLALDLLTLHALVSADTPTRVTILSRHSRTKASALEWTVCFENAGSHLPEIGQFASITVSTPTLSDVYHHMSRDYLSPNDSWLKDSNGTHSVLRIS